MNIQNKILLPVEMLKVNITFSLLYSIQFLLHYLYPNTNFLLFYIKKKILIGFLFVIFSHTFIFFSRQCRYLHILCIFII